MYFSVDRITDNIAVLENEDNSHIEVSLATLPHGTKEGIVLFFNGSEYVIDTKKATERKMRIAEKQRLIFKKAKKD